MMSSWLGKRAASTVPAPISIAPSQEFQGNDGPWSTFPVQIGTPPQTLNVLVSTASSQTWVVLPEGCTPSDPTNCTLSRGGVFQSNVSSTWNQDNDTAGGLAPLSLETVLNDTGTGLYGFDTVGLGGHGQGAPSETGQAVAGIATKGFYLGLFGLNPQPVALPETVHTLPDYLSMLNQSDSIPSLSWGYTAGNQYRAGPAYGSLTLGGYDASRFEPNNISFPFNDSQPHNLVLDIGEIYLMTNDTSTTLSTTSDTVSVFIDSTTPYIILPLNVCEQFEETFNITWNDDVQAYLVNDTLHNALLEGNASVVLNLGDSSTIPGQGINISLPYPAFNLTAQAPLLTNSSRYFPLMRGANESQYALGRTFLQEAYLIADYERKNFSVSQCSWDNGVPSHIVAIERPGVNTSSTTSHRISAGAIVGIVIGALVAIAILVLLAILFKRKIRPRPQQEGQESTQAVEIDSSGKDPYAMMHGSMDKGSPQSPELDATEHKGHELDSRLSPGPESPSQEQEQRFELDATERRSRTLSSPISQLSEGSDGLRGHRREVSDPNTPTRERSDATRLHRRELSDPVSLLSSRPDEGTGTL